jgi:cysteine desulfurase
METAYFDNAATTRTDPRVLDAMLPYFEAAYGNPSSLHGPGREGREAVERSRESIARRLGARTGQVVFTSGGSEANNFALKGTAFARRSEGRHLITTAVEHDSILNPLDWLATQGFEVTRLGVDENGLVAPETLDRAIRRDTILVSVMHANNEIGTVEPVEELARVAAEHGVPLHTDACQSFGKIPLDVDRGPLGLVSLNAHKIYGPKGVGALYLRDPARIVPWMHGGGHEFGLRSSTENVPGVVGFAKAADLCAAERGAETARLVRLRDRIIVDVLVGFPGAYLNGHPTRRLPTNVNLGFHGLEGEAIRLLLRLDERGIAIATGSACSSHQGDLPSHVLLAIGRNPVEARGAVRISLGRFTRDEEVTRLLDELPEAVGSLRSISSGPVLLPVPGGE